MNTLNPQGEAKCLDPKLIMNLKRNDVLLHELAGGGGFGDPLTRDPAQVLDDVRNEYVSVEGATRDYGVVVDPDRWCVDEAATNSRRAVLAERWAAFAGATVLREDPALPRADAGQDD